MNLRHKIRMAGVTLIEMLLVMIVLALFVVASANYFQQKTLQQRVDLTSQQMQLILNAAVTYYVANNNWPGAVGTGNGLNCLMGKGSAYGTNCTTPYITSNLISPWDSNYSTVTNNPYVFFVELQIPAMAATAAISSSIVASLPLGYAVLDNTTAPSATNVCVDNSPCWIVAMVNIPAQNLNQSRQVNHAGLYHHGGCVPVPTCPVDSTGTTMKPQIMVVPVSLGGYNDYEYTNQAMVTSPPVYPLSSFTAYAVGGTDTSPPLCNGSSLIEPYEVQDCVASVINGIIAAPQYWRACVQIVTPRGDVQVTNISSTPGGEWGQYVTLLAITRCAVNNEPAGSTFQMYSN